jgi:hypothetical protein
LRVGPGSAEQREERCTASGTRKCGCAQQLKTLSFDFIWKL